MPEAEAPGLPPLELRRGFGPNEAAAQVAAEIAELVRAAAASGTSFVLGLATGRTMEPLYGELARLHAVDPLPLSAFTGVLIDEYMGLAPGNPARFSAWIRERLAPLELPAERIRGFDVDGTPFAVERDARRYADWIAEQGGIDLLLLGIGRNGHVGFNEPGPRVTARSRARVVSLADETREDAARTFGSLSRTPREAVTLGVAELFAAKRVRVLAFGRAKRAPLRRLFTETPSATLPISLLRGHPDLLLYADEPALVGIR
jgi:glucosamine-6-phosphate deaminase